MAGYLTMLYFHHHPPLPHPLPPTKEATFAEYLSFIRSIGCHSFHINTFGRNKEKLHYVDFYIQGNCYWSTQLASGFFFFIVVFYFPINNKEMHLLTEDFSIWLAACLSWFEAVASDIGPQLTDPFVNQNDLDYRTILIWGLVMSLRSNRSSVCG